MLYNQEKYEKRYDIKLKNSKVYGPIFEVNINFIG